MKPFVTRWFNQSMALNRGPIVFSLDPGESWVKLRDRGMTADWQVFPRGIWNYGLQVDEGSAAQLKVEELPVGPRPFSQLEPPVRLHVPGKRLDGWRSEDGVAAPIPTDAQASEAALQELPLIPYGAAKLRITAFPQLG